MHFIVDHVLRLDAFWSMTEGLAALAHDIPGLLALLGWRNKFRYLIPPDF